MTIRSILVHLTGLPPDEDTFSAALSLGRRFNALVDALFVHREPVITDPGAAQLGGGMATPEILQAVEEEYERRAAFAKDLYNRFSTEGNARESDNGGEHIAASWSDDTGNVAEIVAERAHFVDLVVLAAPSADVDAVIAETAEVALFESGRPIVFVPSETRAVATGGVVLCWDGSPHATRAIFDALPILQIATEVTLLTIREDDQRVKLDRLRDQLERHGISATNQIVNGGNAKAEDILTDISESSSADIIVMGGYGKHPIREFIFGGATRKVLNNTKIPVLMSH